MQLSSKGTTRDDGVAGNNGCRDPVPPYPSSLSQSPDDLVALYSSSILSFSHRCSKRVEARCLSPPAGPSPPSAPLSSSVSRGRRRLRQRRKLVKVWRRIASAGAEGAEASGPTSRLGAGRTAGSGSRGSTPLLMTTTTTVVRVSCLRRRTERGQMERARPGAKEVLKGRASRLEGRSQSPAGGQLRVSRVCSEASQKT